MKKKGSGLNTSISAAVSLSSVSSCANVGRSAGVVDRHAFMVSVNVRGTSAGTGTRGAPSDTLDTDDAIVACVSEPSHARSQPLLTKERVASGDDALRLHAAYHEADSRLGS